MEESFFLLVAELCDFVNSIEAAEEDGFCKVPLANAHRARVIVNNLRPLLKSHRSADISLTQLDRIEKMVQEILDTVAPKGEHRLGHD